MRKHKLELKAFNAKKESDSKSLSNDNDAPNSPNLNSFRHCNLIKFVPKYSDKIDIEFYKSFYKAMSLNEVVEDKWSRLLYTQLTRRALRVFSELSISDSKDYEIFKSALLTAFEKVPESYSLRFRNLTIDYKKTYSSFAFRLQKPFSCWIQSEKYEQNLEKLWEVLKIEQFVKCLSFQIKQWLLYKNL